MPVVNTASPSLWPSAPYASPRKIRPSSSTSTAVMPHNLPVLRAVDVRPAHTVATTVAGSRIPS